MHIKRLIKLKLGLILFQLLLSSIFVNAQDFSAVNPETFKDNMALSNAWADYDNDGDVDLAISFKGGDVRLYQNNDGQFINVGPGLGLPTGGKETRSVAWGDYNSDGYLDLYVGSNKQGNELYRNDKAKRFTEVAVTLGVDLANVSTRQISWVDYDNNGSLDLFVADRVGSNHLFHNDNGKFTDISIKVGLDDKRPTVGACWFDYNQDGLLDLFLANQSGTTDALYRNDGGIFTDVAPELGVEGHERTKNEGGVDCTIGDFNNDGYFDIFVANYGVNYLYKNNGEGGFSEVSEAWGIKGDNRMVGASWADYDNDGWLDLYVAGYRDIDGVRSPHDRLFHNEGGRFTEIDTANTPLSGADHGVQWADLDRDGDLDISLTEGYNIAGQHPVLINDLNDERAKNSLQILVLDKRGHPSRAGAEIRLYNMTGDLLATRLVPTGDGYNSQSNIPVHFGLPDTGNISVEVTFLTENGRQIQRQRNVDPHEFTGEYLVIKQH